MYIIEKSHVLQTRSGFYQILILIRTLNKSDPDPIDPKRPNPIGSGSATPLKINVKEMYLYHPYANKPGQTGIFKLILPFLHLSWDTSFYA